MILMKENFSFEDISEALSENVKSATFCGSENEAAGPLSIDLQYIILAISKPGKMVRKFPGRVSWICKN